MAFQSKIIFEVMVIDDEPGHKRVVDELLRSSGFMTYWSQDWKEAERFILERVDQGVSLPDVIIVDMHFGGEHRVLGTNPSMEGVFIIRELLKTCRSRNLEPPPVIGFTGKEHYMEPEEILASGARDFITEYEFNRPKYFARRLIQSVLEAELESSLKPQPVKTIESIEEDIVLKALEKNQKDVKKTADFLMWALEEVEVVAGRLVNKGAFS